MKTRKRYKAKNEVGDGDGDGDGEGEGQGQEVKGRELEIRRDCALWPPF